MSENNEKTNCKCKCHRTGPSEAIYGFGFIGAVIYFIQHSTSFGEGVVGVIKAIGWPAVVLYRILDSMGL